MATLRRNRSSSSRRFGVRAAADRESHHQSRPRSFFLSFVDSVCVRLTTDVGALTNHQWRDANPKTDRLEGVKLEEKLQAQHFFS